MTLKRAGTSFKIERSSMANLKTFKTSIRRVIELPPDLGVALHLGWCRSTPTQSLVSGLLV